MATEANAIDIKDLCFSFPGSGRILHDISITVPEGDFLAIIGPNGGGKTTLLRLILGLLKPDSGSISVLGESPAAARSRTGYVPQVTASRLGFPITVMDTVLMGMLHTRGIFQPYNSDDRDAAQEKLELLRVTNLAGRRIGDLSGGQRQRVYIARSGRTRRGSRSGEPGELLQHPEGYQQQDNDRDDHSRRGRRIILHFEDRLPEREHLSPRRKADRGDSRKGLWLPLRSHHSRSTAQSPRSTGRKRASP